MMKRRNWVKGLGTLSLFGVVGIPSRAEAASPPSPPFPTHCWISAAGCSPGAGNRTRAEPATRPGVEIATAAGPFDFLDPHTGSTASWEYATWTPPEHALKVPSTEVIASWNARTPAKTWLQVELRA